MFIRRRRLATKCFIGAFIGIIFYSECLVYLAQPLYWPSLKCPEDDHTCTKLLFVADPQIQGDMAVPPPFSYLFNWDSDRYLKWTFSVVLHYFKPDVIVYMGDLMDEGSISTKVQFHAYVKRLIKIFDIDYAVVQIWLPGDNDIGGENEPIRREKVNEFAEVFHQPDIISFKNITIFKVNGITHQIPKVDNNSTYIENFRMVVSHYAVTDRQVFGHQVKNELNPHIFFCAHRHESKFVRQTKELTNRITTWLKYGDKLTIQNFIDNPIYEIYVPTCSYRMGTTEIGFGAAVLENKNQAMKYTVFWSPTRFPKLFLYAIVLVIIINYFLAHCLLRFICKLKNTSPSRDMIPFLGGKLG